MTSDVTSDVTNEMTFRRLGRSGLTVSTVGIGCNNFGLRLGRDDSRPVVHAALDAGITLFDTSDSYGDSEEILGELLKDQRDDVVLATKFGSDVKGRNGADGGARGSRRYIRRAVESSLRRLRTDRIDLYQLHRPDPLTPIDETLAALTELVHEGKVLYVGSSNFAGWQVVEAEWIARTNGLERFISAQNEYNLLDRRIERDLVPATEHHGIGILPYFPLASGLLTGKYQRGVEAPEGSRIRAWGMGSQLTDERFDVIEALEAFGLERGLSLVQVAIGGLAAQPGVGSVIAGATSVEQVAANASAVRWVPDTDELAALDALTRRRPTSG